MPSYDRIAPYYDLLATIVFGDKTRKAKIFSLEDLLACRHILYIGGGTGEELIYFRNRRFPGRITYVEPSEGMRKRALKNAGEELNLQMVGHYWPVPVQPPADGIITHFFLDQFEGENLKNMISQITDSATIGAKWSFADFRNSGSYRNAMLLRIMYVFFRLATGIPAKHLEDPLPILKECGWKAVKSSEGRHIRTCLMQRK